MFEVKVTISAPELAQAINRWRRPAAGSRAADAELRPRKPYPGGAICRDCPDRCAGCTAGWPDLCLPF